MPNPRDWRSEEGLVAWSAFLRAHAAAVRTIDAEVSKTGISLAWYDVLLELNAAPGRRMRMQELGEAAVLSRSRVSRVVDELVAAGLAGKEPNPEDRRSAYASLTQQGRQALRKAAPVYLEAIRRHFVRPIPPADVSTVRAALEAVVAAHGSSAGPASKERRV